MQLMDNVLSVWLIGLIGDYFGIKHNVFDIM